MHPMLFRLGPLHFYSYGLLIAVGFLAASALAVRRAAAVGIDPASIQNIGLTALLAGLSGGRLAYVLLRWELYRGHPFEILRLDHGGLVFYGGLAAGLPAALWVIRRAGLPVLRTVDLLVPPLTVAHAFGRVGCFLNGCCYGKPTLLPWGVRFPGEEFRRHPVQLYETAFLFLLFFVLSKIASSQSRFKPGALFLVYGVAYGIWRFLAEFLRADNPPIALGLTVFQWISLPVVAVAGALLWLRYSSK